MAKIGSIKSDLQKETGGVWKEYSLGIRLKIARARNPKYQEMLRVLMKPHQKVARTGDMETKVFNDILKKVRAETILLGWENIESDAGKKIPYSKKQALAFFNDPELQDFYLFVVLSSNDEDNYRKDLVEDSAKNL